MSEVSLQGFGTRIQRARPDNNGAIDVSLAAQEYIATRLRPDCQVNTRGVAAGSSPLSSVFRFYNFVVLLERFIRREVMRRARM